MKKIIIGFILISIILLITLLYVTFEVFKFDLVSKIPQKDISDVHDFYLIYLTILSISLTGLVAFIAWSQLSGIKKVAKADFLLRIDDRLGSPHIIKAKIIIHEIYRETKLNCVHNSHTCDNCKDEHNKRIREKIKYIGRDIRSAKKFTYLKNFLDFLETIGYFVHQDYITIDQAKDLIGGTIEYHYEIFKDWIVYRQVRDSRDFYAELKWLVGEINPGKYKNQPKEINEATDR